jgi:phosphoribosylamine-glycine ligase
MKLLIIDTDNVGLSYAWRAAQAGHEVRWFVKPKKSHSPDTGKGFKGITKVDNFVPSMMWADLVICTSNDDYLDRLDFFKAKGANVFAPTQKSAALEIDRKTGMELLEKVGIEIAPYKTFKRMEDAEAHVKKTGERFVFKTLGSNENKALTYCSKNPADMLEWMKRVRESGDTPDGDVMLQTFIKGIEFGVSRFMGKEGFVGQWNESFEHKKLMSGNHGMNTGEMGTIAAFTKDSKLGEETLAKCEEHLVKLGHLGDVALGFMIDDEGKPWPTEFTCRFGWPIANLMVGATEGDPVQWMLDAKNGKDTTSFKEDIGCCIVLLGEAPGHGKTPAELSGLPIYGVTKGNKKYLHPQAVKIDMMQDMDGDKVTTRPLWNTAGDYIAVVTGFGKDIKQSAERAYKTVEQLHVSNMLVRDDVGEAMEKQLPELHKLGYATHFQYEAKDKK